MEFPTYQVMQIIKLFQFSSMCQCFYLTLTLLLTSDLLTDFSPALTDYIMGISMLP